MTATALCPMLMFQAFDSNSVELSAGKLYTYAAGTLTPISVYTDISGANTFTNPIILNSRGEPTYNGASNAIWLTPGVAYKFILEDSFGNQYWPVDNVSTGSNAIALNYVQDTGTTNTLAVALAPTPSSYATPMEFFVLVANTNTGATTVNVSSLGPKNVTLNGLALTAGTLQANQVYLLVYDGTYFELLSLPGPGAWITNAYLSVMAAGTVKANITNTSAAPTDVLISTLITAGLYAADTGAANVYVATPTAPPITLAAGYPIAVKIANTNTGASTLNVNSIGATAIQYLGAPLGANMLVAGQIAVMIYDGSVFELINPGAGSSSITLNGYQIFPGGLVLQWGVATAATGSARFYNAVISFPLTFPTGCFTVVANAQTNLVGDPTMASNNITCVTYGYSTTTFTARLDSDAGVTSDNLPASVNVAWVALGH